MEDIQIHIPGKSNERASRIEKLRAFFDRKLAGLLVLLAISLVFGVLIAQNGIIASVAIIGLIIGPPVVYAIVAYPQFGITLFLLLAYLLFYIGRMGIDFPLGTVMDAIEGMLILGFFIEQRRNPNWKIFKSPVSVMVLIWIGFNIMEVANPAAESRLAWVYTIRSVALVMLTYFVFLYQIQTVRFLRFLIKFWLCLAVFGALYAYKQEYIGFTDTEDAWLHSEGIPDLLYISGHWRKFSIFSDPVAFSYNMVVCAIICIALLTWVKKFWQKIVLVLLIALYFTSMLFSGTRGAYVLIPAAMILFIILRINRQVLIFSAVGGLFFLFLVLVPTSNSNIVRFQTAFKPNEDMSFKARKINQKRIQPFILSHPIGGGLGAVGVWGQRFAPNSFLAKFPPDSGYVRVAVELGWVGMFLFCLLMFFILRDGINNYFLIRNPELKTYCLAMVLVVFAYNVGNYPQEAIVQFPSNIYFYLAAAIINVTRILDKREQETGVCP